MDNDKNNAHAEIFLIPSKKTKSGINIKNLFF